MKTRLILTLLAAASLSLPAARLHAQMLLNGSFENPAITGTSAAGGGANWTAGGGNTSVLTNGNGTGTTPYGTQYVYLFTGSTDAQTVSSGFTLNKTYALSLAAAAYAGNATQLNIAISGGATASQSFALPANTTGGGATAIPFVTYSLAFTPTTSTAVTFTLTDTGIAALDVDNVQLVPEPSAWAVLAVSVGALGLTLRRRKCRAAGTLALPGGARAATNAPVRAIRSIASISAMHTPAVRRRLSLVLTLTAVLPALVPGQAAAADFQPQIVSSGTYTNIADTTTTAANQTTTLSFLYNPVIGGGNVAFNAYYNAFNGYGVFTGTAGVKGAATIADYTTTATGQTTVFSSFYAPVVGGGNVAFSANYNAGNGQGVFTGTAGVKGAATIADFTTIAANQTTTFYSFSAPVLSGNNVAFRGSYNSGGSGIFTGTAGVKGVATVADFTTIAANQTTVFSTFRDPVISGNNVAVNAAYNANAGRGIFTGTAGVKGAATVADFTTIAANQTTVFSSFGDPVISGGNVAFNANYNAGSGQGIFTGTVGTKGAATIADYTTKATGQTTVFSTFAAPVLSGNNVAFYAKYNAGNGVGIFTGKVGMLGATTIADLTTTAPGRGLFTSFGSSSFSSQGVAISGNNVAFMGASYETGSSGTTDNGLYLSINGTLTDVAAVGEPLFGSTISELSFFPSGLDGNTVTFGYSLTNGVFGVATTTVVPEPSTWALLGVGTAGLGVVTLRRRVARAS